MFKLSENNNYYVSLNSQCCIEFESRHILIFEQYCTYIVSPLAFFAGMKTLCNRVVTLRMYLCTHAFTRTRICTHVYTPTYTHANPRTYMRLRKQEYSQSCAHIHTHLLACTHISTPSRTYTPIHAHTRAVQSRIYTHIRACMLSRTHIRIIHFQGSGNLFTLCLARTRLYPLCFEWSLCSSKRIMKDKEKTW